MKRHLVYHVYPVPGETWRRRLDQVATSDDLFDGRRIFAVVTDKTTETFHDVANYLEKTLDFRCEFLDQKNDPRLREVKTWHLLWECLDFKVTDSENDVALYAHAKGVSRPSAAIDHWSDLMWESLTDWDRVAKKFASTDPVVNIVGSFLKNDPHMPNGEPATWHYSGTYFWVRLSEFWKRPWREVSQNPWGVEAWPGLTYKRNEAAVLIAEGGPEMNLYNPKYLRENVKWRPRQTA